MNLARLGMGTELHPGADRAWSRLTKIMLPVSFQFLALMFFAIPK
jgi:hypothetical protein